MTLTELARQFEPNATARDFFDPLDNAKEHADDMAALEDKLTKMEQHIESDGLPTFLPGMKEEILDTLSNDESPMMPHLFTSAKDALAFILAGNAYFTLRSKKTGTRFTYRVARPKKAVEKNEWFYYVSLLNGPDNTMNYTYMANLKKTLQGPEFWQTPKCKVGPDAPSSKAIVWTLQRLRIDHLPDNIEIWHEGRCGRCGRKLTVPESIAAGIGPECAGRM